MTPIRDRFYLFRQRIPSILNNLRLMPNALLGDMSYSFSQHGEDSILLYLAKSLGNIDFTYLDIGANHPIKLNNTYLLYTKGFRGVLIEPDTNLVRLLKNKRKEDKIVQCGVAGENKSLTLYKFNNHTLNTFSRDEAEAYLKKKKNYKITSRQKIPVYTLGKVIEDYFPKKYPNLISIDIEGMELEVLEKFDFEKYKIDFFCLETYSWARNQRIYPIINLLKKNGYNEYVQIGANSIFIRQHILDR